MDTDAKPETTKPETPAVRDTFLLACYGGILLVAGLVVSLTPQGFAGLLIGGLGISMLTVGMLRRYR